MTTIPIEVSARHIHLTAADWRTLFGGGGPTVARPISQVPQFVASERVTLQGPKGVIERVAIVGPFRDYTQVELAQTDALRLGVAAPLAESGHLEQAAPIDIIGPRGRMTRSAAILQQRHIHAGPAEAAAHGLHPDDLVTVTVSGPRGGQMHQVLVRVDPSFQWQLHVDTDEANAFGIGPNTLGQITP
ncbi:MAG: hypothetical protein HY975_02195 [Candidatus Kerfeldbacteria bacterium]|nr:hypothetical protein [Candidatus Kerfeldbacteria bacterium]